MLNEKYTFTPITEIGTDTYDTVLLMVCPACIAALPKFNVPEAIRKTVDNLLKKNEDLAKTGNITEVILSNGESLQNLVIAGFGGDGACKPNDLRKAAGEAVRALAKLKATKVLVVAPILTNPSRAHYLVAFGEGILLGGYKFTECKSEQPKANKIDFDVLTMVKNSEAVFESCDILAHSVCLARDLTNRPGNVVNPEVMATEAEKIAKELNLECEILGVEEMKSKGMNAILAVGQGSVNPPRMITLKYCGAEDKPCIALVGKGITFDSGGISIKPEANMGEMKDDMAGAAAVLGAIEAAARLKLPCNLIAILACAENMPSGSAQRPGDIVKAASGKTIEVISTDAEGRMVLADAVWYACRQGAKKIVDIATLTGGVIVALGTETAGIISNNDAFAAQVINVGKKAGEAYWQLPSLPECKEAIKSSVADLKNSAGREASTITGGLFIGEFIDKDVEWVHIDIGGTSTSEKTYGVIVKGGTGVGVRTLVNLLRE